MKSLLMVSVLLVSGLASASQLKCKARVTDQNKKVDAGVIQVEGQADSDGLTVGKGVMQSGDLTLEVQTLEFDQESRVEYVGLIVRKKMRDKTVIVAENSSTSRSIQGFQSLRISTGNKYVEIECEK